MELCFYKGRLLYMIHFITFEERNLIMTSLLWLVIYFEHCKHTFRKQIWDIIVISI